MKHKFLKHKFPLFLSALFFAIFLAAGCGEAPKQAGSGDIERKMTAEERAEACRYRGKIEKRRAELAAYYLTNAVANCDAKYRIVPAQDLLCLGAEARMNTPGTDSGNWQWRATKEQTERIGERLKELRSFPHE